MFVGKTDVKMEMRDVKVNMTDVKTAMTSVKIIKISRLFPLNAEVSPKLSRLVPLIYLS